MNRSDDELDSENCRNCGAPLVGSYCHDCGQVAIRARLSLSEFLREIPTRLFSLERGLWLTFLSLWIRPGQVCTDYIRGKRRPYVNPISYFLIGASFQLVSLWFTAPLIRQSVSESIQNGRLNAEQAKQFQTLDDVVGGDSAAYMGDMYLTVMAQGYTYLAFFAFTCPLAFCLWQGHRRLGSKYHFAEVMVFSLYVVAQCLIVTAISTQIFSRIGNIAQLLTAPGFYAAFLLWAHTGFFSRGFGSRVISLGSMAIAVACFFASIVVVFAVSLVASIVWLKWTAT